VGARDTARVPEQPAGASPLSTVSEHLEHIERGDLARAAIDYAQDGVLAARRRGVVALEGTFEGRTAIGDWLETWFSSFEPGSYRFEIEESIENGDRIYLAILSIARGEASGAETTMLLHHAFTLRNGLIARHVFSGEREEIRREAGVAR
jgi:ketosteroid isomerase-like protein